MTKRQPKYEPVLLNTYLSVVAANSFSESARRLGLRQSTVSQHIARLEKVAGCKLIARDTHRMELTTDGLAMVEFATAIIDVQDRARRYFSRSRKATENSIRLGAGGNFGLFVLPKILPVFRAQYPHLDVEVRIGTPEVLYDGLKKLDLDLIVVKSRSGEAIGRRLRREKLIWVGRKSSLARSGSDVPLVLLDPPSTVRSIAIAALEREGRTWRINCSSGNANGLRAAVLAGLGVTVQSESMIAPELAGITLDCGLPELGFVDYHIVWPVGGGTDRAKLLAEALFEASRN
jgi:DNA-binding transcriptional LysR family regulator